MAFISPMCLLHLTSGILLYFLLRRLFRPWGDETTTSLTALLVALLWIVHPVHSAAVDYISGRADSLAFAFALRGVVARSAWVAEHNADYARFLCYALAGASALLALCSREIAVVWFILFLLHIFLFDREASQRFRFVSLGCCIALLALYVGLRQLPEQRPHFNPSSEWSRPTRAVLMLRALGDYGRLMVFPSNLHMERTVIDPNNYRTKQSWRDSVKSEYLSILGLLIAAATSCRMHSKRSRAGDANFRRNLVCRRLLASVEHY